MQHKIFLETKDIKYLIEMLESYSNKLKDFEINKLLKLLNEVIENDKLEIISPALKNMYNYSVERSLKTLIWKENYRNKKEKIDYPIELDNVFDFGKYIGKSIIEVYKINFGYLNWILENTNKLDYLSDEAKQFINGNNKKKNNKKLKLSNDFKKKWNK